MNKYVFIMVLMFSCLSFAEKCKLTRSDGTKIFGSCVDKDKNTVLFYSCLEYFCLAPKATASGVTKSDPQCNPLEFDILALAKKEHKSLDSIKKCKGF